MDEHLCKACGARNLANANFCGGCGEPLKAHSRRVAGAPPGRFARTSPAPHVGGNDFPVLTLLPLDPLPPAPRPVVPVVRSAADLPAGTIRSDPDPPGPPASDLRLDFSAAKARRRAQVRQARVQASSRSVPTEPASTDVLLFDRDDASRKHLAELLEGFGFVVYPARSIGQADALLSVQRFAVVVLDVALDGRLDGPAAVLCQHAKRSAAGAGALAPTLIVITERARSADRVRAELSGADGVLVRPPGRGDFARVLEDIGVPLPSDPRGR